MMKQKPVVLRQRRQEEGLSHEIMGNSVKKREEFSQSKEKQHQVKTKKQPRRTSGQVIHL
jgi:hypothetical protein